MKRVFKDKPIYEITIRKFESPSQINSKDLIRRFCISIGLLQPGDSRDIIVEILEMFLKAKKQKKFLKSEDIEKQLKNLKGSAGSNIRRHLLRLKRYGIIEKMSEGYRIKEWDSLENIFKHHIENFLIKPAIERILEYCRSIDNSL